jgi:hypothetical protein
MMINTGTRHTDGIKMRRNSTLVALALVGYVIFGQGSAPVNNEPAITNTNTTVTADAS